MNEGFYVVIAYFNGGKPEVSFHPEPHGAIMVTRDATRNGADVTVYHVTDLPRLVTGEELRKEQ